MSLSQRFGQADEKRRSGGQNNKNVTVKIDASAASPKGAKNGMKKSNSGAQPQKGGKKAQGNPKNAKPVKKAGPKRTSMNSASPPLPNCATAPNHLLMCV